MANPRYEIRNRRAARLAYERKLDSLDRAATYCLPLAIRMFDNDFKRLPMDSVKYWIQLREDLERYLAKASLRMRIMEDQLLNPDSDNDHESPYHD